MSTLFAIKTNEGYVNIAVRIGSYTIGKVSIEWISELAPLLSNKRRVYPLDNTAQGVLTIGDLKKLKE